MTLGVRGRNTRALVALAAALGLYLLVSQAAFPAYDRLVEGAESVSEKESQLRRFRRALEGREQYAALLEQARKSIAEGEARLIPGENPSLASAELQKIVEDVALRLNIELGPRSMSPARRVDDYFNEITVTTSFEATPNQMTSFLAELRAAPRFVTVKNLQVAPVQPAEEMPANGELKKTVKASVTVSGMLASPPAPPRG